MPLCLSVRKCDYDGGVGSGSKWFSAFGQNGAIWIRVRDWRPMWTDLENGRYLANILYCVALLIFQICWMIRVKSGSFKKESTFANFVLVFSPVRYSKF